MYSVHNKENFNSDTQQPFSIANGSSVQPFTTRNAQHRQSAAFQIRKQNSNNKISFPVKSLAEYTEETKIPINKTNNSSEIDSLKWKLEIAYIGQHKIDNLIEEYQVSLQQKDDLLQAANKKRHELQSKCVLSDEKLATLQEKVDQLEREKKTISEKWVKLSSRIGSERSHKSKSTEYKQALDRSEDLLNKSNAKICELQKAIESLKCHIKKQDLQVVQSQNVLKQMQWRKLNLWRNN